MSNLISGKEALIALANGEEVEYKYEESKDWNYDTEQLVFSWIKHDHYQFRLKPRTITINGIEVPAPFEPKEGDEVWFISDDHPCGYAVIDLHKQKFQFGAWRTESEIKQVVKALRSVFK